MSCNACQINCALKSLFAPPDLEAIALIKREVAYSRSETIIKQGAFVSHLLIVKTGIVKTISEGGNGKNIGLKFFISGNIAGISALGNKEWNYFSAIAQTDCNLCLINITELTEIIFHLPESIKKIQKLISEEFKFLFEKIAVNGTRNMHGKLANTLLYLNSAEFKNEDIFSSITRKEIAELSGMSVESMLKILQELKADKIISTDNKSIIINDMNMLQRLSKMG